MSTGACDEGLNFAAVRKAPLVVIGEDNKYAYSTPTSRQSAARTIDERASGYGVARELVDGNDMLAVYDAAKRMVDRARAGEGTGFVGVDTMRMQGHAQHDDMRYVPRALVEEWAPRDPILGFRRHLVESGTAQGPELDEVDAMARSYAAEEARAAEDAPAPDPATLTRGVYAGDDFVVPRLELVRSPFAEGGTSA
jgi:TPP-dependent pyruvate/acetoin dehydrogenase alpha subunit